MFSNLMNIWRKKPPLPFSQEYTFYYELNTFLLPELGLSKSGLPVGNGVCHRIPFVDTIGLTVALENGVLGARRLLDSKEQMDVFLCAGYSSWDDLELKTVILSVTVLDNHDTMLFYGGRDLEYKKVFVEHGSLRFVDLASCLQSMVTELNEILLE